MVVTFAIYWPARNYPFIDFDDPQFVEKNEIIRSGLNRRSIHYAFTETVVGNWHPITTLSHALDCELFGLNAGSHHMVSVLIHATNSALLFLMLVSMISLSTQKCVSRTRQNGNFRSSELYACYFVAALFALHPLRVESVTWIAERKDLLSGFFFMLSILTYTKYVKTACFRSPVGGSRKDLLFYSISLLMFLLGLMSKPMLVTLPFVLLLLDLWPLQRLRVESGKNFTKLLLEKLPFFLLSAGASVLTILSQKTGIASPESLNLQERLVNAVTSYASYLHKIFWPKDLAVFYPHHFLKGGGGAEIRNVLMAFLVVGCLTVLAVGRIKKQPYLFTGWFWFLGMLVPVIGLVQVGEQSMADRYTYLPAIGLSIATIWLVRDTASRSLKDLRWLFVPALAALLACALQTSIQLKHWRGTVPLFEHTLRVTGENIPAQYARGVGLEKAGNLEPARKCFEDILAKNPHHVDARNDLARVLVRLGEWDHAVHHFQAMVASQPRHSEARINLAGSLVAAGRYADALAEYEDGLKLQPDNPAALNNFAWFLATCPDARIADGQRAVKLAARACELAGWKEPRFLGTLAAAMARVGRFEEAMRVAQNARDLAIAAGNAELARQNSDLIELYSARQPYTQPEPNHGR